MKSKKIKKILAGVQTAAVVAGISIMASGCHGEKKGSCGSSCGGKSHMEKSSGEKSGGSCGKGSCSK